MKHMKHFLNEHRYYYLLLYVPFFLLWFFLIEQINTPEKGYWVSYLPLDDKIPFVPIFALIYCLWYPFLIAPNVYLLIKEPSAFKRFMWFFMTGISLCLLICTVFPNGQDLRPASFASDSFCTRLMQILYQADTNTNVLPSMHVVGSIAVFYGAIHSKKLRKPLAMIPILVMTILISLSTVFVKQHSVLDIIWGVIVSVPVWLFADWLGRRFPDSSL